MLDPILAPQTILLVENEAIIAMAEAQMLRAHGFAVIHAATGEEAIDKVRRMPEIDLILLDVQLEPGMDGTEAARRILQEREFPLVFLSSHTEKEVVEKTHQIPAYGYVVKNAGVEVLVTSIKMAYKLFRAHQQLKEQQNALRASEEKLHKILDNSGDAIVLADEGGLVVEWNPAAEQIFGLPREEVLGQPLWDVQFRSALAVNRNPVDYERLKQALQGYIETGHGPWLNHAYDQQILRPDGSQPIIQSLAFSMQSEAGYLLGSISRDVTERHRMADELRRQNEALNERVKELNCLYRISDLIEQPGITLPEILQGAAELLPAAWKYPEIACARIQLNDQVYTSQPFSESAWVQASEIVVEGMPFGQVQIFYTKEMPVVYEGPFIQEERALIDAVAERLQHVIERLRTAEALQVSLVNNNLLLSELQHRTKNTLAMIASIVNLETDQLPDPAARQALDHIRDRIRTLSVLYQQLFTAGAYQSVRLDRYFGQVLQSLQRAYTNASQQIQVQAQYDEIEVDIKMATALGLILNELITNALKYAFTGLPAGTVWVRLVRLEQPGDHFCLEVENDGLSLPDDFRLENPSSLGMQLVQMLVLQMEGELTVQRSPHTLFRIQAPLK